MVFAALATFTRKWGGECQCDRCMMKTPRDGFFRADRDAHYVANALRQELDYWMEQQIGHDPKLGRPGIDDTVIRGRSFAEIRTYLDAVRLKYPRAFRTA